MYAQNPLHQGKFIGCIFISALLFALLPGSVRAASIPPSPSNPLQENLWSVTLNGVDKHETVLFLREAGDKVLASGKDLQSWRLRLPALPPLMHHGETFYPLDRLRGATYRVDEAMQAIAINVPADGFISSTISNPGLSPPPIASSLGGFLNYDAVAQYNLEAVQLNALTELGVFNRWGVGTTTLSWQELSASARIKRLDSAWTVDIPDSMTSLRFGDAVSQPGEWGGAVRFGGFQWATNFATQPRFIPFPLPAVAGEAVLPSTVDVYVNNALQMRTEVPAGPFSLTNLPVMTGQGDARVVLTDLLGREQIIIQPYYVGPQLLSRGVHNYSYEIGLARENYGINSFDYGRALAAGTHRYGFSDRFTGEIHGELLAHQQTLGASGNYLWPDLGVFNLSLAGSHSSSGLAPFAAAGFQRQARWFSITARIQLAGKGFTQIGLQPGSLAPREISNVSASISFGRYGSLNLGYIHQDNRDRDDVEIARAGYNVSLGKFGSLNLGYSRSLIGEPNDSFGLTFTFSLDERTSANLGASYQKDDQQAGLQIQRNLPRGNGFGYRLHASAGSTERFGAAVDMQNNVGLYNLEVSRFGDRTGIRGGVSGGVAMMGINPHFSRRLTNSFALVRVPGIPNVRIYADNQLVGFTDADGDALIPQLRAYQRNPIRIEQADLPFDAQFDRLELEAVPYFRSGHELNFAVKRSRGALFNLVLADGQPMPSGALVKIIGQDEEFPVALKGEVYMAGLQANNRLRATWKGQSCEFAVAFPELQDPLPNLGSFTCLGINS